MAGRAQNLLGAGAGQPGPAYATHAHAAEARDEWVKALGTVPLRALSVTRWVVCDDATLSQWAAKYGMPANGRSRRKAADLLREGLDAVARHWGL